MVTVALPERAAQRQPRRCRSLRCVRHRSGWHGAAVHCGERQARRKPQEQKAEKTPEEKRKAFGALVRDGGEYSDIFNEVMQQAIIKAGEAVHTDPKAAALPQALSEAYGIDGEDVDGLIEAVKNGKVKDNAY